MTAHILQSIRVVAFEVDCDERALKIIPSRGFAPFANGSTVAITKADDHRLGGHYGRFAQIKSCRRLVPNGDQDDCEIRFKKALIPLDPSWQKLALGLCLLPELHEW